MRTETQYQVKLTWDDGTVMLPEISDPPLTLAFAQARVDSHRRRKATVPGWRIVDTQILRREVIIGDWEEVTDADNSVHHAGEEAVP